MDLTDQDRAILASLVLDWLTRCQYGDWPGDSTVSRYVALYGKLAPKDADNVALEGVKAKSRDRWKA